MNLHHRIQLFALSGLAFCLTCSLAPSDLRGQTATGTISGGWRMPLMEDNKLKTLLTGEGADSLESGEMLISRVKIQLYDDEQPPKVRMIIEAPECLFDPREQNASSAGPISLQAADESFSIEGRGFVWNQNGSQLSISNQVKTVISRTTLQGNRQGDVPIHVQSDRFDYDKTNDLGIYQGNVVATEGERFRLLCETLRVQLPSENDSPDSVIADGNVHIELRSDERVTFLQGRSAHYETKDPDGSLTLTGDPSWRTEEYSGRGDTIKISGLNTTPVFAAGGNASMTIPLPKQPGDEVQKQVDLRADQYTVSEAGAIFIGNVQAQSKGEWELSSQRLNATIDRVHQTVTHIEAQDGVQIRQTLDGKETIAQGDSASFTPTGGTLTDAILVGRAMVQSDGTTSRAQRIELKRSGASTSVNASGQVSITLPRSAGASGGFLGFAMTPNSAAARPSRANASMEIRAGSYQLESGIGRFEDNVVIVDTQGTLSCRTLVLEFGESHRKIEKMTASEQVKVKSADGDLQCEILVGHFSGAENRLVTLVAQERVSLKQQNGTATGEEARFDVATQVVELSGEPELRTRVRQGTDTRNVVATAELLIWDQARNTFKGRGRYRVRTLPYSR